MSETPAKPFDRLDYVFKISVVLTIFITAAVLARDIIIPMAFAGLLAVVMLPVVRKLEVRGLGTALSITLVLLITVVGLGLLLWLTVDQIVGLVNDLPNLQAKLESFVHKLQLTLRRDFGISMVKQTEMFGELMKTVSIYLGDVLLANHHQRNLDPGPDTDLHISIPHLPRPVQVIFSPASAGIFIGASLEKGHRAGHPGVYFRPLFGHADRVHA
jgi:hypothetical protein